MCLTKGHHAPNFCGEDFRETLKFTKVFSLKSFPLYGVYLFPFADHSNTKLRELPLPFQIPLPMECTVAGTNARSYNQGQCSRNPVGQPQGSVHNRGNVVQGGRLFFKLTTSNREVALLFQEARHQHLEMTLNIHPSLAHELTVILKYIKLVEPVDKIHQGFGVSLASNVTEEEYGIKALLKFPPGSLVNPESNEVYYGPRQVLHSLYTMANNTTTTFKSLSACLQTWNKVTISWGKLRITTTLQKLHLGLVLV